MATYKYIYWCNDIQKNKQGERFANIHLLIGYNQGSVRDFKNMADEIRKTFPRATDDKIFCGRVIKSSYVQQFSIATLSMHIPEGDYPDWVQKSDGGVVEYNWY